MTVSNHTLFIDSREKPDTIRQAQSVILPDGHSLVMKLDSADFLMVDSCTPSHSVGIERKTVADLLGAFVDEQANGKHRLRNQLDRMMEAYTHPLLVIEGPALAMSRPGSRVRSQNRQTREVREIQTKGGKILRGSVETGWHHGAVQMMLAAIQRDYAALTVLWVAGKAEFCDLIRVIYNRTMKGCLDVQRVQSSLAEPLPDVFPDTGAVAEYGDAHRGRR